MVEAVGKTGCRPPRLESFGHAQNFIECGREQAFLMLPSLLDWVPEDHLVWTIVRGG
jgi:hypothetical protein